MNRTITAAAVMAAALAMASGAAAQEPPIVSLRPEEPARWDFAAHAGWLGGNESGVGAEWDDWYNTAAAGVSGGYYVTPHLKAEVHGAVAREGRVFGGENVVLPGQPFRVFRVREHFFQATGFSAAASYQFFENQWFHPVAGGGLEVVRERHRIFFPQQFVPSRDPIPVLVPAGSTAGDVSYFVRPFFTTGFKLYVTERAFMRSDLRTSFSSRGLAHVTWSGGVGVDL
jgi:opacity protein-like surface antigen